MKSALNQSALPLVIRIAVAWLAFNPQSEIFSPGAAAVRERR